MPYKSQDFQTMCANFVGARHIPNSVIEAAKNYHPRLHRLLTNKDQKVFESDMDLLANFVKQTQPDTSAKPYDLTQKFHHAMRDLHQERLDKKTAPPAYRLGMLKKQMDHLRELGAGSDPAMREKIKATLQRFNIHHLKTQAARRAAATDFVDEVGGAQQAIALLTQKTNIRKARTLTERREKADELVHSIVDRRAADSDRHQTNPGMDPSTGRPLLAG